MSFSLTHLLLWSILYKPLAGLCFQKSSLEMQFNSNKISCEKCFQKLKSSNDKVTGKNGMIFSGLKFSGVLRNMKKSFGELYPGQFLGSRCFRDHASSKELSECCLFIGQKSPLYSLSNYSALLANSNFTSCVLLIQLLLYQPKK